MLTGSLSTAFNFQRTLHRLGHPCPEQQDQADGRRCLAAQHQRQPPRSHQEGLPYPFRGRIEQCHHPWRYGRRLCSSYFQGSLKSYYQYATPTICTQHTTHNTQYRYNRPQMHKRIHSPSTTCTSTKRVHSTCIASKNNYVIFTMIRDKNDRSDMPPQSASFWLMPAQLGLPERQVSCRNLQHFRG